ncbi:hypothetical protein C8J57DRAFT_1241256 [Mycena rebaudengoi]|nr:hypothetical protein C8J57DRAFT_1241256 [Mycena rebaudengoi]
MEYTPRSFNDSLSAFGFNYLDMSIRYPGGYDAPTDLEDIRSGFKILETPTLNDNWAALEKICYLATQSSRLEQLFKTAKVVPAIASLSCADGACRVLPEKGDSCNCVQSHRIRLAKVRGDPLIVELAGRYKVSQAQITAIPKSQDPVRQQENIASPVPVLSSGDVARITGLDRGERFFQVRLTPVLNLKYYYLSTVPSFILSLCIHSYYTSGYLGLGAFRTEKQPSSQSYAPGCILCTRPNALSPLTTSSMPLTSRIQDRPKGGFLTAPAKTT